MRAFIFGHSRLPSRLSFRLPSSNNCSVSRVSTQRGAFIFFGTGFAICDPSPVNQFLIAFPVIGAPFSSVTEFTRKLLHSPEESKGTIKKRNQVFIRGYPPRFELQLCDRFPLIFLLHFKYKLRLSQLTHPPFILY